MGLTRQEMRANAFRIMRDADAERIALAREDAAREGYFSAPSVTQDRANPAEATGMTLTLPLPPNMANGRMHWRAKNRQRVEYFNLCDYWQAVGRGIPAPPAVPFAFAEIAATLVLWNPMDDDGAIARLKWAIDWLVTRGYIAGDSRKHLRWAGIPAQTIDRKGSQAHVHFTLSIVEAARW